MFLLYDICVFVALQRVERKVDAQKTAIFFRKPMPFLGCLLDFCNPSEKCIRLKSPSYCSKSSFPPSRMKMFPSLALPQAIVLLNCLVPPANSLPPPSSSISLQTPAGAPLDEADDGLSAHGTLRSPPERRGQSLRRRYVKPPPPSPPSSHPPS